MGVGVAAAAVCANPAKIVAATSVRAASGAMVGCVEPVKLQLDNSTPPIKATIAARYRILAFMAGLSFLSDLSHP
jgi:hypothetical protein